MAIEILWQQVVRARAAVEQLDSGASVTSETMAKLARLYAEASFALQTYDIAHVYGLKAATLFKLSDGNIDPRPIDHTRDASTPSEP